MQFTTYADTAAYTAAAALDDRPVPNQLFVAGDSLSFDRLVREVEAGLGASITVRHLGSFSELDMQIRARHAAEPANVTAWLPLMYWRAMLNGSGQLGALMNERCRTRPSSAPSPACSRASFRSLVSSGVAEADTRFEVFRGYGASA
jgi:hypothetical protein